MQSRYYDPETGRFLNADDVDYIGLSDTFTGWNAFAYCENDPVNDSDSSGYLGRTTLAWLLDIVLTLVAPYFSGPLDVWGRFISYIAKKNNFKLIWNKLLYGAVPQFRGLFCRFFTSIRTCIWRVTGSFISNSCTTLIGLYIGLISKNLNSDVWKKRIDIISCFFSAGSMIAGLLDYADGSFDGDIKFGRLLK